MMTIVSFCVILAHVVLLVNGVTSGPTSSYVSVLGSSLPGPLAQTSVQFVRNLSLNQCAAECSLQYHTSKFPCYAFQYASATRLCFLTNVTTLALKGGYLALKHNPNMRYFERPKGSYTNLFQPFPGQVLRQQSSYFAVFHNKSLENCARFCLIESRDTCMSFSYSATKRVCGLSKVFFAEGNGQKLAASGAYTHYQYFTTWPCNATIPWNYAPRAIASPYFPYASVTDVNCFLIIEAPEGKQVDLTFSTLFTQQNICQSHNGGGLVVKDGQTSNGTELSRLCSSDDFVNRRFVSTSGYLYLSFSTGSSPLAFKGVYEFKTVDPCADSPCQNHGTCIPTSGRYACACAAGYTGSRCETDVDDCASSPCYFGGRCVDLVGDYRCDCQNLFGGKRCDKFVGLCYLDPCQNGGTCFHRGVDSYVCNCPTGHTGQNCSSVLQDPCSNHSCQNGATCIPDYNTQTRQCACAAGFTGNECETNMDDCASSPCLHNIPCTDLVNDFKCECPKFMSGKTCENFIGHCYESDCLHGKCRPTGRDNITCDCDVGYTGSRCEVLFIDFCDPNPCKHGACSSFVDGPVCQCDLGYEGMFCEDVVDYCRGVNCSHGECATKEGHFTCNCIAGYQGRYCNESINHCLTADCHGGYCINTVSSHFCVCSNGRTGLDCDVGATTSMTSTTMRSPFLNVVTSTSPANPPYHDYCNVSSCLHGACDADFPTVCVCDAGFSGPQCDVFAGCARSNPCLHGNCTDVGNSGFMCNCEHGYSGQQCDVLLKDRDCSSRPCQNGGFCLDLVPGYQCVCVPGHRGDHCQWTDACARGPCITGTCVSRDNGFRCRVDPLVGTSNSTTAPSLPGWAPARQQPSVHRFSRAGEESGYPAGGHREPVYSWAKSPHHDEDTESVWAGVTIVAKRPSMKAARVAETRSATDNTKAGKLARHSETRVATKRRGINKIATNVLDSQQTIKQMEARENRLNSRVSDLKHDHAVEIGSNYSPVSVRTDRAKSLQSPNCSTRSANIAHGQNKTNTAMVPVSKPESGHHKPTLRCNDTTNSQMNDTPQTNTNTQEDSGEILTLFDAMKGIKIQPPAYWIGCSYIFFSSSNAIGIIIRQTGVHPKICKGSRKIILELSLPSMKSKTRTIVLINSAKDNSFKSHKVTFRDIPTGSVTQQTLRLRVWVKKGLLSKELLEEWTVPMQRCEPIIEHTDWQRCQF